MVISENGTSLARAPRRRGGGGGDASLSLLSLIARARGASARRPRAPGSARREARGSGPSEKSKSPRPRPIVERRRPRRRIAFRPAERPPAPVCPSGKSSWEHCRGARGGPEEAPGAVRGRGGGRRPGAWTRIARGRRRVRGAVPARGGAAICSVAVAQICRRGHPLAFRRCASLARWRRRTSRTNRTRRWVPWTSWASSRAARAMPRRARRSTPPSPPAPGTTRAMPSTRPSGASSSPWMPSRASRRG